MENTLLKLVDLCSPIYKKMGIDFEAMKAIVKLKLTMDKRRTTLNTNKKTEEKKSSNSIFIMNIIFGIALAIILIVNVPIIVTSNIYLGGILFFAIMTTISDFSTVLLDIKDRNILIPRPISEKTLNAAKVTHISLYLIRLILSLSLAGVVIGTIKFGILFFLIVFLELIVISLFIIVISALLYSIVLKFFDGEKLKDIINYFQIFITFMFSFGYQIIIRIFDFDLVKTYTFKTWHLFIPSMWFAGPLEFFIGKNTQFEVILLCILVLVIPIGLILVYFMYIGPEFEKNLAKMYGSGSSGRGFKESKMRRLRMLAGFICRNREEKESFIFTVGMISKERSLKMRVYPAVAMAIVFPFLMILNDYREFGSLTKAFNNDSGGYAFLFIYLSVLLFSISSGYIGNSENYKGAWIYKVMPIKDVSNIKKGATKANLYKLVFVPYIIMSIIYLMLSNSFILIDILIVFNITVICYCVWFKMVGADMPFSKGYEMLEKNKNIGPGIIIFLIIVFFAILHGIIFKWTLLIKLTYLIVSILVMAILWRVLLK